MLRNILDIYCSEQCAVDRKGVETTGECVVDGV